MWKKSSRICVRRKNNVSVVVISPVRNKNVETVIITEARQSQQLINDVSVFG